MEEKYVNILKESARRNFPSISEEEIERIAREAIEETKKMEHINLESYDREAVINYLTKERQLREHDAKDLVSSRFAYYDSLTKERQLKALTEGEKSKCFIAEIESIDHLMKKAGLNKKVVMNVYRQVVTNL